ncbi:MAG: hypothetical protein ACOCQD_00475 [archaeon]
MPKKNPKLYIATSSQLIHWVELIQVQFKHIDIDVISSWHNDKFKCTKISAFEIDKSQIEECDILLAIHPISIGSASEATYAMSLNKYVVYHCPIDISKYRASLQPEKAEQFPLWFAHFPSISELSFKQKQENKRFMTHHREELIYCLNHIRDRILNDV